MSKNVHNLLKEILYCYRILTTIWDLSKWILFSGGGTCLDVDVDTNLQFVKIIETI